VKSNEIRDMTNQEIRGKILDAHQELFNLRFQLASRQLTNHRRLMQVRRDIARLMTIMREKELAEAHSA